MIQSWLEHIKAAPDENAIRLLVDRIEVENEKKNRLQHTEYVKGGLR